MRPRTLAITLAVMLHSWPAASWGREGHRIVAMLAESQLEPGARKRLETLTGGRSLASLSMWADELREIGCDHTKRWHYVNIPVYGAESERVYQPSRDCAADPTKGDCVIATIEFYRAALEDRATSDYDRLVAVALLVHFIGDIHQPLHAADNRDAGGNWTYVRFFDDPVNLHALWDSTLLDAMLEEDYGSEAKLARALMKRLSGTKAAKMGGGTPIDWAHQAHGLAMTHAYDLPRPSVFVTVKNERTGERRKLWVPRLGQPYLRANASVVEQQLLRAGVRLGRLLNRIGQVSAASELGATCPRRP